MRLCYSASHNYLVHVGAISIMVKPLLPVLFSTSGVAAAGVASYVVFVEPNVPDPVVQPATSLITQVEPQPELKIETTEKQTEVASLNLQPEDDVKPEIVLDDILPTFSVLRVETDGNAVIAGSGPADSEIELFDGEISIAKTASGSSGDFAFVLEKPLAPGLHQLTLVAKTPDGKELTSAQAGLVNVPLPQSKKELTVLVTEPGVASRVLIKPEPEVVEKVDPVSEPEVEVAKVELDNIASDVSKVEVKTQTEDVSVSIKNSEVAGIQPDATPVAPVLIEAADVEADKLFIAGTGEAGMIVNLYLDGELLGKTNVSEKGAFLFEGRKRLSAGKYDIRADMSNSVSGKVVARAEVKLVHEPQVAEINPAPVETEQPVKKKKTISLLSLQGGAAKTVEPKENKVKPELKEIAEDETLPPAEPETVEVEEEKVIRTGSSVIIRRGDNLWRVARRNYGAGIRYTTIFDANRDQVRNPDLIYPGQVLKVPEGANSSEQLDQG